MINIADSKNNKARHIHKKHREYQEHIDANTRKVFVRLSSSKSKYAIGFNLYFENRSEK